MCRFLCKIITLLPMVGMQNLAYADASDAQVSDDAIAKLVACGYNQNLATRALRTCRNDLATAKYYLRRQQHEPWNTKTRPRMRCFYIGVFVVYIMKYSFANFCFTYSPEMLIIWTDGVLLQPLAIHWGAHATQWFYSCTSCRFKYYKHKAMLNLEDRRKPFQYFPGWKQVMSTRVWSSASYIFSILLVEFAVVEWIPISIFSDISKNRLLRAIS